MGVLLALTFSLSVFAAPQDNIQSGNIIITGVSAEVSHSFPFSTPISLAYGQNHLIKVNYSSSNYYEDNLYLDGRFTLTLTDDADLYFSYNAFNNSNSSYDVVPQSGIEQYRDSSKDFTDNNFIVTSGYVVSYDGDEDEVSYSTYSPISNYDVAYKCYSNVPAGTYLIEYSYIYMPSSGNFSGDFILGLYAVDPAPPGSDDPPVSDPGILDGFKDGTYSFEQALEMLISNMDVVLDNVMLSTEYKNFYVNYTSAMIDILEKESDIIYNSAVSDFNDIGEQIVDDYISSGQVSPYEYIDRLQQFFTDALTQANTAEQGSFLSSCFQNILAKLQLAFDMQYKQELDDTITDSQLDVDKDKQDNLLSKYFEEDELREKFSQAEFEALSNWRLWLDDIGDYTAYRSIFNYIFTEFGVISTIVQIPFVFMIVALLLGTAINRSSSEKHSRREVEKNSDIRSVDE